MASAQPATQSAIADDNIEYFRLCHLLVGIGTKVLREVLDSYRPDFLNDLQSHSKSSFCLNLYNCNGGCIKDKLQKLKKRRILNPKQWDKLYPISGSPPSLGHFDITLLFLLLRETCNITPPTNGWNALPDTQDTSVEADLARIKYYRNVISHGTDATINKTLQFTDLWKEISDALTRRASHELCREIVAVRNASLDPTLQKENEILLNDWCMEEKRNALKLKALDIKLSTNIKSLDERVYDNKNAVDSLMCDVQNLQIGVDPQKRQERMLQVVSKNRERLRREYSRRLSRIKPATLWCHGRDKDFAQMYVSLKLEEPLLKREEGSVEEYEEDDERDDTNHITIASIFDKEGSNVTNYVDETTRDEPRVILFQGDPGIGKTSLCNRLIQLWSDDNSNHYIKTFDLVFLLECRQLEYTVIETIRLRLFGEDISEDDIQIICDSVKEVNTRVCFIIDGYDELDRKHKGLESLLDATSFEDACVIITTRPDKTDDVIDHCHKFIKVLGFDENSSIQYIKNFFCNKDTDCSSLISKVQNDRIFRDLSHSPLNTELLCLVFEDTGGDLPRRKIDLLNLFRFCITKRFFENYAGTYGISYDKKLKDLPKKCEIFWKCFEKLAYCGISKRKFVFDHTDLIECVENEEAVNTVNCVIKIGFLKEEVSLGTVEIEGHNAEYSFLHKTIQEYFCALYLAKQNITILIEFLNNYRGKKKQKSFSELCLILPLVCGLAKSSDLSIIFEWLKDNFKTRHFEIRTSRSLKKAPQLFSRIFVLCAMECEDNVLQQLLPLIPRGVIIKLILRHHTSHHLGLAEEVLFHALYLIKISNVPFSSLDFHLVCADIKGDECDWNYCSKILDKLIEGLHFRETDTLRVVTFSFDLGSILKKFHNTCNCLQTFISFVHNLIKLLVRYKALHSISFIFKVVLPPKCLALVEEVKLLLCNVCNSFIKLEYLKVDGVPLEPNEMYNLLIFMLDSNKLVEHVSLRTSEEKVDNFLFSKQSVILQQSSLFDKHQMVLILALLNNKIPTLKSLKINKFCVDDNLTLLKCLEIVFTKHNMSQVFIHQNKPYMLQFENNCLTLAIPKGIDLSLTQVASLITIMVENVEKLERLVLDHQIHEDHLFQLFESVMSVNQFQSICFIECSKTLVNIIKNNELTVKCSKNTFSSVFSKTKHFGKLTHSKICDVQGPGYIRKILEFACVTFKEQQFKTIEIIKSSPFLFELGQNYKTLQLHIPQSECNTCEDFLQELLEKNIYQQFQSLVSFTCSLTISNETMEKWISYLISQGKWEDVKLTRPGTECSFSISRCKEDTRYRHLHVEIPGRNIIKFDELICSLQDNFADSFKVISSRCNSALNVDKILEHIIVSLKTETRSLSVITNHEPFYDLYIPKDGGLSEHDGIFVQKHQTYYCFGYDNHDHINSCPGCDWNIVVSPCSSVLSYTMSKIIVARLVSCRNINNFECNFMQFDVNDLSCIMESRVIDKNSSNINIGESNNNQTFRFTEKTSQAGDITVNMDVPKDLICQVTRPYNKILLRNIILKELQSSLPITESDLVSMIFPCRIFHKTHNALIISSAPKPYHSYFYLLWCKDPTQFRYIESSSDTFLHIPDRVSFTSALDCFGKIMSKDYCCWSELIWDYAVDAKLVSQSLIEKSQNSLLSSVKVDISDTSSFRYKLHGDSKVCINIPQLFKNSNNNLIFLWDLFFKEYTRKLSILYSGYDGDTFIQEVEQFLCSKVCTRRWENISVEEHTSEFSVMYNEGDKIYLNIPSAFFHSRDQLKHALYWLQMDTLNVSYDIKSVQQTELDISEFFQSVCTFADLQSVKLHLLDESYECSELQSVDSRVDVEPCKSRHFKFKKKLNCQRFTAHVSADLFNRYCHTDMAVFLSVKSLDNFSLSGVEKVVEDVRIYFSTILKQAFKAKFQNKTFDKVEVNIVNGSNSEFNLCLNGEIITLTAPESCLQEVSLLESCLSSFQGTPHQLTIKSSRPTVSLHDMHTILREASKNKWDSFEVELTKQSTRFYFDKEKNKRFCFKYDLTQDADNDGYYKYTNRTLNNNPDSDVEQSVMLACSYCKDVLLHSEKLLKFLFKFDSYSHGDEVVNDLQKVAQQLLDASLTRVRKSHWEFLEISRAAAYSCRMHSFCLDFEPLNCYPSLPNDRTGANKTDCSKLVVSLHYFDVCQVATFAEQIMSNCDFKYEQQLHFKGFNVPLCIQLKQWLSTCPDISIQGKDHNNECHLEFSQEQCKRMHLKFNHCSSNTCEEIFKLLIQNVNLRLVELDSAFSWTYMLACLRKVCKMYPTDMLKLICHPQTMCLAKKEAAKVHVCTFHVSGFEKFTELLSLDKCFDICIVLRTWDIRQPWFKVIKKAISSSSLKVQQEAPSVMEDSFQNVGDIQLLIKRIENRTINVLPLISHATKCSEKLLRDLHL